MSKILNLLLMSLLWSSCLSAQNVGPSDFYGRLEKDSGLQLLDVRTLEEFEQGHLEKAMLADWLDKEEFARRIGALDKAKPVLVYCLSGGRSAEAAAALRNLGFSEVVELDGGIAAWRKEGLPEAGVVEKAPISAAAYQGMLASSDLVLVDFGAPWCPPCRKMAPIIEELADKYSSVLTLLEIDGGTQGKLMEAQAAKEMPTFILYLKGKEVWRRAGIVDRSELVSAIERYR